MANERSGRGSGRRLVERLTGELRRRGISAEPAWTPEARRDLVERAGEDSGCRCLVAVGGDGTVGDLINERPSVPLTVLPAGTENLFARQFGMSRRPERVAAAIAEGTTVRLDLGLTNGRRFALMAGVGFDADVVTRHHFARPGTTSRLAYVEPVLRSSLQYRFPPLKIRVDDPAGSEVLSGSMAFVFNLPAYALGLLVAPLARGDDGKLDLVVFRDPGPFRALQYLWKVVRGIHLDDAGVTYRKVHRVTIEANEPVPVQLDGDPGGRITPEGPWMAEVLPAALELLVPGRASRAAAP